MPRPAGLVMLVAPVTVVVPPPPPCRNATPLLLSVVSEAKVREPAELFWKETASVPPVTEVAPKVSAPVLVPIKMPCNPVVLMVVAPKLAFRPEPAMLMPCVPDPETFVEPKATVPPTVVSEMPGALVALVVVTPLKPDVTANEPLVKLSA